MSCTAYALPRIVTLNITYREMSMKKTGSLVATLALISGCALVETPDFMQHQLHNQYFEKTTHADPTAYYIGEWTAATGIGLVAIKINPNGNIKMCASNEHFGTGDGKVFKENETIKMIFDAGTQYEILSKEEDYLLITSYGQEYKHYANQVPDRCKEIFSKFETPADNALLNTPL